MTAKAARSAGARPATLFSAHSLTPEPLRPEAPHSYVTLPALPENSLDNVVELAAIFCQAAGAVLLLADDTPGPRAAQQMPGGAEVEAWLGKVVWHHARLTSDVFEVEEAALEAGLQSEPAASQAPRRFCAGAPLVAADGRLLGVLCVLDTVPRRLLEPQRHALRVLAREVVAHLELRRAHRQLEQEQGRLENLRHLVMTASEALRFAGGPADVFIKQDHKLMRLSTADIRYVEALGDYVNIYTRYERYTVYNTMKELEARLPAHDFARVHRKYIVRLDRIVAIESDAVVVEASRSTEAAAGVISVPIGNSYKAALLGRISLI
ncbi:GAF domain-containing DNA-binding protein [Hymenobacter weizhouensis]|uniref:GAF domain-containing DNA-binding protein n=1 Tax=Hymenobacter sp. YIM 151500-1 TaxID=2987689 RepID=UPI0022273DEA|nr:GAF domain-containing DNA-binding protein [Hymenobacter sp. YIM 151500-1]UYZ62743.1 GAF domain-containing DNA-binding protein [Hymenobacter sp. YIM 151500-1]